MSVHGCAHLGNFKSSGGSRTFEIVHGCFVACIIKDSRKRKAKECFCHICYSDSKRLHACLFCIFFGCYNGKHIHEHARTMDHFLAIDVAYGTIYCFRCGDYVYDKDLDAISRKQKRKAATSLGISTFVPWEPSSVEIDLLKKNPKRRRISDKSYIGLRGLLNLGNTCFMNCIVQVFTHTPLLRDFFLADCHICQFTEEPNMCLVCEMSRLFQEFYSGKGTPFVPHRMLQLLWTHTKHLAGYEQKDAHEYFVSTLDVLHQHFKGSNNVSGSNSNHCSCIVCQIFTGGLQSDVICQTCQSVSTTTDPFWDISLDLGINSHNLVTSGETRDVILNTEPSSLLDCLERFTRPEHLGSSSKIYCNRCQSYEISVKQLTMKQLPIVACFHLKRFEVTSSSNKKITTYISFPQCLDMTPFMPSCRSVCYTDNTNGENHFNSFSNSDNKYYLFAVVNHDGEVDVGHYISYIKLHRDQWFECNDDKITRATVQDVLNCEGYLLFYHKQILEYESVASS